MEPIISSDAALGLAVLLTFLAMMLWGVFQTFWPSEPRANLPRGGHGNRRGRVNRPVPVPVCVSRRIG